MALANALRRATDDEWWDAVAQLAREDIGWALLDSVHGGRDEVDVEGAWADEIRRRLDDLREGLVGSRPWAEVEAEIRAKLTAR